MVQIKGADDLVVQVVSTNFDGTFSTNSGSWTDITGFNLTITPSSSSSKILLLLQVSAGGNDFFGLNLLRGSTVLNYGSTAPSSRQLSTFGSLQMYGWSLEANPNFNVHYLDSPATTSAITYKLQGVGRYGTTSGNLYINRPNTWNNDSISGRVTASNLTALEIRT